MAYCAQCGGQIADEAKFCIVCGASNVSPQKQHEITGTVIKCPNCGDSLKPFAIACTSCGYELRGALVSESVREFTVKLEHIKTEEERADLVRTFPIPNTKEDIFDFIILASSNIAGETRKLVFEAWIVKFEQCYQKAELIFSGDADFTRIKNIYEKTLKTIKKERTRHKLRTAGGVVTNPSMSFSDLFLFVIKNAGVWIGIAFLIATIIDYNTGGNGSMLELIGAILLIASASVLNRRKATYIEFIIAGLSGIISIALSYALRNGAVFQTAGGLVLIITAFQFFRKLSKGDSK